MNSWSQKFSLIGCTHGAPQLDKLCIHSGPYDSIQQWIICTCNCPVFCSYPQNDTPVRLNFPCLYWQHYHQHISLSFWQFALCLIASVNLQQGWVNAVHLPIHTCFANTCNYIWATKAMHHRQLVLCNWTWTHMAGIQSHYVALHWKQTPKMICVQANFVFVLYLEFSVDHGVYS